MRHLVGDGRKLGRPTGHRMSMLKNLVASFFEKERIRTTVPRAKELRSMAEKMITLAKKGEIHHRRQVARVIQKKSTVRKLFEKIAPRFSARNGGYTRIILMGPRVGDGAETAYIELLGSEFKPKVTEKEKGKGKGKKKEPEEGKEAKAEETAREPIEKKKWEDRGAERVDIHAKGKVQKQHIKAPGE